MVEAFVHIKIANVHIISSPKAIHCFIIFYFVFIVECSWLIEYCEYKYIHDSIIV